MKNRPPRRPFLSALLALGLVLTAAPASAQQAAPYDHPLFTGPEQPAPTPAFDQEHLRLALRFDRDARRVLGDATLRITPLDPSLDSLVLHASDLAIDSVLVGPVDSTRLATDWRTGDADSLVVALTALPDPEAPFEVRIVYAAQPEKGLYFVEDGPLRQIWTQGEPEDHHHWIPLIDRPGDKLTSELLVTVTPPQRALSNGRLIDAFGHDDGTITYHWHQEQPHAPYLIMLAVGDYATVRDQVRLAPGRRPVALAAWVYPDRTDDVERTFGRTDEMMRFYSERLAFPYPWAKYDQVLLRHFQFGGMENTSATTLTDRAMIDDRAALDYDPDGLIAHELVHQWFGNLVTCRHWSEIWLNEGFATYGSALFQEAHDGPEAFDALLLNLADRYLNEAATYRRPLVWNRWTAPIQMFDAHSYQKGAWVLHMLRQRLGDDVFWDVLGRYLDAYAFQPVETSDFQQVVETVTERDWDAFFDQWVYGAGHPEVTLSYDYDAASGTLAVTARQTQTGFRVPDVFTVDLSLDVHTLTDRVRHTMRLTGREQRAEIAVPGAPRFVSVDPEQTVLMQATVEQPARAWVAQLRNAPQPVARVRAARALAAFEDDPALLIGLRSALQQEEAARVRRAIVASLDQLPPSSAIERTLLDAYENEPSSEVRRTLLTALSAFSGSEAVSSLAFQAAQSDQSYYVQAEAVRTLARIGATTAEDVARSALVTPSFREVIRQAAFDALALLDLPDDEVLDLGSTYSAPSQPAVVRAAALGFLATRARDLPRARQQLIDALDAAPYRVRQAAIQALGTLDDEAARTALRDRRMQEPQPRLRQAIDEALASRASVAD
jgi:aminopeptidase N